MSSAPDETHESLSIERTLMSRFKEVQGGSTHRWNPDSPKSLRLSGFLDANFSLEIYTTMF